MGSRSKRQPTAADFTRSLEQLTTGRAPAMREVFALAKTMMDMPLVEVRVLLASDEHLHHVGAVSVLDFRARRRLVTNQERAPAMACTSTSTT